MQLLGSVDGNLVALLSAHQSIGVPQPLKLFGSRGAQEEVPAPLRARRDLRLRAHRAERRAPTPRASPPPPRRRADGAAYVLNGTKLWCTNGTIAELLVVMAVDPEDAEDQRLRGRDGLAGREGRAPLPLHGPARPRQRASSASRTCGCPPRTSSAPEGKGLKIALTTLNDGRLSIPNGSVGTAKICLEICRKWASERVQWGKPVGKHEAIAHKIADHGRAHLRHGVDRRTSPPRCPTAAATTSAWRRRRPRSGTPTAPGRSWTTPCRSAAAAATRPRSALAARGEQPIGVERMMRDYRINKIFEGSSEIMHLFMAREMVDKHLQVAGAMIDPDEGRVGTSSPPCRRWRAFYGWWYPTRWLGWGRWPRYSEFGRWPPTCASSSAAPASWRAQSFHGMLRYQAKLQNKQAFLFRLVDVANELFAMAASVAPRAGPGREAAAGGGGGAASWPTSSAAIARRRVARLFDELWSNDDVRALPRGRRRPGRTPRVAGEGDPGAGHAGGSARAARRWKRSRRRSPSPSPDPARGQPLNTSRRTIARRSAGA